MDTYLQAALDSAAATAQQVLGETFTLGGATYSGIVDVNEAVMVPTPQGYEPKRGAIITATLDQFAAAPDPATRPLLVARGITYRLVAVRPGPLHYHLTATLA